MHAPGICLLVSKNLKLKLVKWGVNMCKVFPLQKCVKCSYIKSAIKHSSSDSSSRAHIFSNNFRIKCISFSQRPMLIINIYVSCKWKLSLAFLLINTLSYSTALCACGIGFICVYKAHNDFSFMFIMINMRL